MPDREWPIRRFRPSTVERMPYLEALTRAHVDGRLDETVYHERVDAAAVATSFDALDALVADVPFDAVEKAAELAQRQVQRANRRQILLGAAGFAGVGLASFAFARLLVDDDNDDSGSGSRDDQAPADGSSATAAPGTEPTSVATTMFQYSGFTATAVAELLDNANDLGLRQVADLDLRAERATVNGLDGQGRALSLSYWPDTAPSAREATLSGPFLRPAQLRDLDLPDLLARTRQRIQVSEAEAYIVVRDGENRGIFVYGGSGGYVRWDLTGTRVLYVSQ